MITKKMVDELLEELSTYKKKNNQKLWKWWWIRNYYILFKRKRVFKVYFKNNESLYLPGWIILVNTPTVECLYLGKGWLKLPENKKK